MAQTAHDDSFREIQLSGKQLVFLFMAVIVILVGVFLMGLQVGRGVLMARGAPGAEATIAANEAEPPPPPASASPSSTSSPATAGEKLSYAERLGAATPPKETLKPEASSAPAEAPSPKAEAPDPSPAPAPAKIPTSTPGATSTPAVASKPAPPPAKTAPTPAKAAPAPAPAPAA